MICRSDSLKHKVLPVFTKMFHLVPPCFLKGGTEEPRLHKGYRPMFHLFPMFHLYYIPIRVKCYVALQKYYGRNNSVTQHYIFSYIKWLFFGEQVERWNKSPQTLV